jgi:hypothetical protein
MMKNIHLSLSILDDTFSVCRLAPEADLPNWVPLSGFVSVTRTNDELSVVCPSGAVPDEVEAQWSFKAMKIEGPLDFGLTGILLAVAGPLTDAGIPIFSLSTYDTDYVLVRRNDLTHAVCVLEATGHRIQLASLHSG